MLIALGIFKPILKASGYVDGLAQMGTVAKEIKEILDYPEIKRSEKSTLKNDITCDISFSNLQFAKPDAGNDEVMEATKKARCYDFIMALPDGFDTMVGEGGSTLFGGEKQRIAIARAILKDSPIVILDEFTNTLDAENEYRIMRAIDNLVKVPIIRLYYISYCILGSLVLM